VTFIKESERLHKKKEEEAKTVYSQSKMFWPTTRGKFKQNFALGQTLKYYN
jgi:hypothetical protein